MDTVALGAVFQRAGPMGHQNTGVYPAAAHDAPQHKVDAVFLEVETEQAAGLELMQMLRSQKAVLPVFIISETDHLREKAMKAGANGYFLLPDSEQQLLNAVRLVKTANEYRDN